MCKEKIDLTMEDLCSMTIDDCGTTLESNSRDVPDIFISNLLFGTIMLLRDTFNDTRFTAGVSCLDITF